MIRKGKTIGNRDTPETRSLMKRLRRLCQRRIQQILVPADGRVFLCPHLRTVNNVLSIFFGSKEHGGHVRGMSYKLSIKDGFEKDRARYRSHDHYKEEIMVVAENVMHAKFKDLFIATLAEQQ